MTDDNPSSVVDPGRCPLCGADNHCAVAAGTAVGGCWCAGISIDPGLLEAIPSASRGRACICQDCAKTREKSRCKAT